jgi:hypothetical protein
MSPDEMEAEVLSEKMLKPYDGLKYVQALPHLKLFTMLNKACACVYSGSLQETPAAIMPFTSTFC